MSPYRIIALILPLLVFACDKDKRKKPSAADTAPTHDTGASPEPGCDTGYLDDDGECVPAACGTGTWGNLEVDESTVYVDTAAAEGGVGSEAAPFTSIQAGLDAAGDADGGMVAVAAGTYLETLELGYDHGGVHLAGRCRELVTIDASVGDEETPGIDVDVPSLEVEVSGVTVSESRYVGVMVRSGSLTIRDSVVAGCERYGVVAYQDGILPTALTMETSEVRGNTVVGLFALYSGTTVTLRESAIEDSQPAEDGGSGFGIEVTDGASLDAEACVVRGNATAGVLVAGSGTSVTLRETIIEDTEPDAHGDFGIGIYAYEQASLVVEGCQVRGSTDAGVQALDSGTSVSLRETTIEGSDVTKKGEYGVGIQVTDGARLDAESCEVRGIRSVGIVAGDVGTSVTLLETIVEDTQSDACGDLGYGIQVAGGARLDAEACEVRRNEALGVLVDDPVTRVTLRETTIEDTQALVSGEGGFGIVVRNGASLDAEACQLRRNTEVGLSCNQSGTSVTLRETTIEDTQLGGHGEPGYGIFVAEGASLDMESGEVIGSSGAGLVASDPHTSVTLRDTRISSTSRGGTYTVGFGIAAQRAASLLATGIEVTSNEGPGLYANGEDTQLTCSGCTIQHNQFSGAVVVSDAIFDIAGSLIGGAVEQENLGGGVGIFAWPWDGGPPTLTVTDNTIQDNAIAGVWLAGEGSFSLSGNTIHGGEGWTRESLTKCGDAVYARDGVTAWDGTSGLLLEDNILLDGLNAGLFLDNASATLSGNSYADNAVDLVMQGGDCATAPEGYEDEAIDSAELCPTYDYATCGDEFALHLTLAEPEMGDGAAFMRPGLPGPGVLPAPLLPQVPRLEPLKLRPKRLRHEPAPPVPLVAPGEH